MKKHFQNPIPKAFVLSNLIACPFFGIFALLPMILCKELHASPFQISTMTALKPLTALFASYWSSSKLAHQHQLSLVWAYILKFAPFILIPFFSSPWIFICAFGIHMLLMRAVIPTWMELLKQNLSKSEQGKICASVSTMNYLCLAFIPLAFGWALDFFENSWRVVFIMTSLLGISSAYIIYRLVSNPCFSYKNKEQKKLKDLVINPWKTSFNLLSNRRDFFRFQVGFFFWWSRPYGHPCNHPSLLYRNIKSILYQDVYSCMLL